MHSPAFAPDPARPDILDVRDLTIEYHGSTGRNLAVQHLNLSIAEGEVVALVGESGSGKSTTAYAIAGLLQSSARVVAGSVRFGTLDLITATPRQLNAMRGTQIGFVPQDPTVSLNPLIRVGDQVAETMLIHNLSSTAKARESALQILAKVGFLNPDDIAMRYPHQLSGGQRQRVLISIALLCSPKLIIADEPTSALDVTVQRTVLDLLSRLQRERKAAMLLITHDLAVAAQRSQRIIVMNRGKIVETGPSREILENPKDDYTRRLLEAIPGRRTGAERRTGSSGTAAAAPLLSVRGLVKDYSKAFRAVDNISFDLRRGSTLSIVGESGSGKSTLARMVMRLIEPTSGSVEFEGRDLTSMKGSALRSMREHFQIVQQNPFASLDPRFTIRQIIEEPLRSFGRKSNADRRRRVIELLDQVALGSSFADRRPSELSGGQRQRVAIARALALDPRLVVLDEPVSALDVSVQSQILQLLRKLQDHLGLTYLFISHDLAVVREISDDIIVMQGGHLVEQGAVEDVFERPAQHYTRQLLTSVPALGIFGAVASVDPPAPTDRPADEAGSGLI